LRIDVALRMCGNVDDAGETMQETFVRAIKALPTFEGRTQLSTWIYSIAPDA
jgi:RNA polymerase sigma-70 factor (ECF subfamily)